MQAYDYSLLEQHIQYLGMQRVRKSQEEVSNATNKETTRLGAQEEWESVRPLLGGRGWQVAPVLGTRGLRCPPRTPPGLDREAR